MAVSREEIKEALGKMPVIELVDLIKELEDEWGVSAAAPVAVAAEAPLAMEHEFEVDSNVVDYQPAGTVPNLIRHFDKAL